MVLGGFTHDVHKMQQVLYGGTDKRWDATTQARICEKARICGNIATALHDAQLILHSGVFL